MLKVGSIAKVTKLISEEDVYLFAGITGDRNPVHTSKEFAEKSNAGERTAHEMFTAGLISAALGMKLPGPGCYYLSQTLHFISPVKIGDEITARVEVVELITDERLLMKTQCLNQRSELVVDGEAIIMAPRPGSRKG